MGANAWARLRVSVAERAGVWVWFPRPLRSLHAPGVDDLGQVLEQIGRDVRAGRLTGGSIAVPLTRRTRMKVEMSATGPDGFGWDFTMNYKKLSVAYATDLASLAGHFASLIASTGGAGASGDPAYTVSFAASGADLPAPHKAKGIVGEADNLLYSQMLTLQDAGFELLRQANVTGHNEVVAGRSEER